MSSEQMQIEKRKMAELAARYSAMGYQVLVEPRGADLPAFLSGFMPDMIVRSGDEQIIIEIKQKPITEGEGQLERLAQVVSRHPGWHLRIVFADQDDVEWRPPPSLPSQDELRKRLLTITRSSPDMDKAAMLLLLWSIIEGAARHRLASRGVAPTERLSSSGLIKQLLSEGWIDEKSYARLVETLGARNAVAHGFLQDQVGANVIAELIGIAEQLLQPLPSAAGSH